MTTNNRAHQIRPAGIFCGPWEALRQPQSLLGAHRCALTVAPHRVARLRQSRTGPTFRAPSRSRCASTARTTNIGKIFRSVQGPGFEGICDERRPPFEDDVVRYYGQYVAVAVADTFEAARAAADAVRLTYAKDKPNVETDLKAEDEPEVVATTFMPRQRLQSQRGNAEAAFATATLSKLIGISDAPTWVVAKSNTLAELQGWTRYVGLQINYSLLERTVE